ncbi:hypothetical protein RXV94_12220 [Yeosuana sp. MJ-SS3]|uniref:Phospholipase/carboxylesterase/thioesterase domain-containing protein n=1 Tax=Gilvirhabdus luticola TaxID=3079858 RepID=A0ABU3U942_9FLAO|nr:hypothetical protein [Yeosuana sp. MJ-SS3]MDU8886930.1 hypothetical protein [Yeosuana sp. MJ-SS3]
MQLKKFFSLIVFLVVLVSYGQKKYSVVLPENFNNEKNYPLFIALHGGHGNMKDMQTYWKSPKLYKDFIVVYMEASTLDRPPNRYGWRNIELERKNIKGYYDSLINEYNIDLKEVYIGGFSLGARTSIDLVLNNIIPTKGFILLNIGGGLSEACTEENVKSAKERHVKGVVMVGEIDYKYKQQSLALIALLEAVDFNFKFIENKNTGHTTPSNFESVLDNCLEYIK